MNICAPATATGGAIAIIRISGPEAITIAARIFHPASGRSLLEAKSHTLHYGEIISVPCDSVADLPPVLGGSVAETLDDALASVFRAPHSYTGEDSVELSLHGSPYITKEVLRLLCENGCRMAEPGEFTQRAFLGGKLDLSQAEAVADLIASKSQSAHHLALTQLKGGFSRELAALRDQLLHLTTLMELELDFADHEDLEFADRSELISLAEKINRKITALADSFRQGNAMKNGIPVAIVGAPNVGKSTLLNALLKEEKAIVSDIPGTTRDYIEDTITLRGIDFRFIDTAGLRHTTDRIESLGIARTKQKIEEALIILHLSDTLEAFNQQPPVLGDSVAEVIPLLTKADLVQCPAVLPQGVLPISAKTGHGLAALEDRLVALAEQLTASHSDTIVTNARHHEALIRAHDSLQRVLNGLADGIPTDLLAEDLRLTLAHLGEITGGTITSQEVLNNIWSHFCIGK